MENEIDLYTNFSTKDIEDFKIVGIKLCQNLDRICFTKYCRNLINFIINNTKFNFLIEFLSQVNSEILNDYQENKKYVKEIINLNNILLDMIKSNEFKPENFNKFTSDFNIISNYIYYLTKLNDINYYKNIYIVGSYKIDRIYINYLVTKNTILEFDGKNITYLNDIYNNFICLSNKALIYFKDQEQIENANFINNIVTKFNNKKNIDYVKKSINQIMLIMNNVEEIQPYIDSYRKNRSVETNPSKNFDLSIILGTTITLAFALALKLSN
jgi:hypothetical protein